MPPKKADKVPRRARARGRAPARGPGHPGHGTGLKVVGAAMVVLAVGVGWLSNLGGDGADRTALPYRQDGVTTIAGGEYRHLLPSTRAAVPVPFGVNTMVTVDHGLVTTTTTTAAPNTTGTSVSADPERVWVSWETVGPPGGSSRGGDGRSGSSTTARPATTTTRPTTTRPTTTTTRPTTTSSTTTSTSTTSTSTTSTSTTTTTRPTTTTEPDGSSTTQPDGGG